MFDAGLWEFLIIFIIGLLVIGPERLPGVARKIGFWVGRARRFVANVRSDLEQEFRADELKEILDRQNQEIEELKGMMSDVQSEVHDELGEAASSVSGTGGAQRKEGSSSDSLESQTGVAEGETAAASSETQDAGDEQRGHEVKSTHHGL